MAFTAAQVMKRASTILQDAGAVRWTLPELCDWLNEGLRAIVGIKPNAATRTVTLPLVEGTRQALPAQYTMLSRVLRNSGTTGRAVQVLARREILDSQIPGWHSPPYAEMVQYVWQDAMNPREFYVVPGNDASGSVEAIVGVMPEPVPIPATAADALNIESYAVEIALPDLYQNIVLDMLLYRAFSKDGAAADAAQRSTAHLELANAALNMLNSAEVGNGLANQYAPASAG